VESGHRALARTLVSSVLALLVLGGCGRRLGFDVERLHRKCGIVSGVELDARQARCVARVAGLRDRRKCPLELTEHETAHGTVFRARESCAEVGLEIDARTGRIVAVELGEGSAPAGRTSTDGS